MQVGITHGEQIFVEVESTRFPRRFQTELGAKTASIVGFGRINLWDAAVGVLTEMLCRSLELDCAEWGAVGSGCSRAQRWEVALSLFKASQKCGIRSDVANCGTRIQLPPSGREHITAHVGSSLAMQSTMTRTTVSLAARCSKKAGGGLVASSATLHTCTSEISKLGKQRAWRRASCLVSRLRHASLRPDVVTLTALSGAFGAGQQWLAAVRMLDLMRATGC